MNLYQILEIEPTASQDEIKSAYRRLVFLYHPDKNPSPDAKDKFIQVEDAYTVLSDESKRRRYDRRLFRKSSYSGSETKDSTYTPTPGKSNYTEWLKYQRKKGTKRKPSAFKKRVLSKREEAVVKLIIGVSLFATAALCLMAIGIENWIFGEITGRFVFVWMFAFLIFKGIRRLILYIVNRNHQKHI